MPDLEQRLAQLGADLVWPVEPDVASRVLAHLGAEPPARRRLRALALALAASLSALVVALAVPPARSAILDFLGLGAVRVERVETLPALPAERVVSGRRVSLGYARRAIEFPLAVPAREPVAVYLDTSVPGSMVTFVWEDRILSQLRGGAGLLEKVVTQEALVRVVDVHGADGLWIEDAHGLSVPGGPARLAGNVLVWARGTLTFRLEGDLTLAEALAFAGTLRRSGT